MIGGIWTNRPDAFASQWKQVNAGLLDSVNASLAKLRHWQDKQAEHQQALQTLAMELEQGRLSEAKAISNTLGQVRFAGLNYQPVHDCDALQAACTALGEAKRGTAARKVNELWAQYSQASMQSELGQLLQRHQKRASAEKTKALVLAVVLIGLVSGFAKVMVDNHREELRIAAEARAESERMASETKAKAEAERSELPKKIQAATAGAQVNVLLTDALAQSFALVPSGSFTMGSSSNEEGSYSDENQVAVTLSQSFWLAKTEVTQAHWKAVMGSNPCKFKGPYLPVVNVSWEDAQAFIAKLNDKQILPQGWKFALPSEAQWEYACRAGEKGPYSGGTLDELGWYDGNSGNQMHEVGHKKPNAWGLYDMHGNVYEWCSDWYEDTLKGGADPVGPASGDERVYRDGCWASVASGCRAAYRSSYPPNSSRDSLGFRLALVPSR
jgi:formylglycine-generating enzyme required for sulfatase activity